MQTIKIGSKCDDVKTLQNFLGLRADGIFGQTTHDAVVEYQKKNGLLADGVVGKNTWESIIKQMPRKCKRDIKEIIIHCTATPEGQPRTLEQIRQEHIKVNGWNDIGYHILIGINGEVWEGRSFDKVGAHCAGHNSNSIGVCYVGGVEYKKNTPYSKLKPKDTRTPKQKEALLSVLKKLKQDFPQAKIYGHHDFNKGKACPCFDPKNEYKNI